VPGIAGSDSNFQLMSLAFATSGTSRIDLVSLLTTSLSVGQNNNHRNSQVLYHSYLSAKTSAIFRIAPGMLLRSAAVYSAASQTAPAI
jgi:hypothetical protein